jgi:putative Holliday junction resolvase
MTEGRRQGRILGLDVGARRIGVAVSDPDRRFALPLNSVDRKQGNALEAIADVVRADEVEELVVGLPLTLSGEHGPQAASTKAFADELTRYLNLPVHLWDERLSTREAEHLVSGEHRTGSSGRRRAERSRVTAADTDALAASIILQAYLDRQRLQDSSIGQ